MNAATMVADDALTYLFVPGNRPERFAKALAAGADRVILDLEDAVAPADKAAARRAVAEWIHSQSTLADRLLVRINDDASPWYADDLALLAASPLRCVMLPKCESPAQVAAVLAQLPSGSQVLPLIETACGLQAVQAIAAAPGVARLAFGSLDFMLDLDVPEGSLMLAMAAAQIALASRAAGLPAPVAGVTPALDAARVSADMVQARSLGFGAKMCIHPAQVAASLAALAPSAGELAWAERVLQASAAAGGAALQLDGKMVDRPVLLRAERLLALARRLAQTPAVTSPPAA
jgi:citrate lyase subunit beta/citryl-CoA lyase